jgi:murein DD-endopeptidase MepM/ murein hydrolase activator NlpD
MILALCLCLAWLAACGGTGSDGRTTPTPEPIQSPQVRATARPPTPTPSPVATLTPTITSTPLPPFQICSPLEVHPLAELREITSDPYRPPPPGSDKRHQGIDFSYYTRGERTTIQGVGLQSVLPGRVAAALVDTFPFGNLLIVETSNQELPDSVKAALEIGPEQSLYLLYAHMDAPPQVKQGDAVWPCQLIGAVGKSGNAVEPHLHLEVRRGPSGATFESMGYYQADHTEQEKASYLLWRTSGTFQHLDPMRLLNLGLGTPVP